MSGTTVKLDAWYRYNAQRPPAGVKVRVMWDGHEFIATWAEHAGRVGWAEFKLKSNGQPSADPTPVRLAGEPDLWQPQFPELWKGRLPEPVTLAEAGRMVAEKTRFALVDEAEAADLAAEMEADRAAARAASDAPKCREPTEVQWWRDISQIKYQKAPNFTLRMVEGRLMRAVACCGVHAFRRFEAVPIWIEIGHAAAAVLADIENCSSPDIIPQFVPLPADEDDFLTAMSWFVALYPPEQRPPNWKRLEGMSRFNRVQKVILWRAKNIPRSFDEIAKDLERVRQRRDRDGEPLKGEAARKLFEQAKGDCWRMAMGLESRKGLPRRIDHIAAVREANRRAKAS